MYVVAYRPRGSYTHSGSKFIISSGYVILSCWPMGLL